MLGEMHERERVVAEFARKEIVAAAIGVGMGAVRVASAALESTAAAAAAMQ